MARSGRYSIRSGIGASPGQYAPDAPGLNLDSKVYAGHLFFLILILFGCNNTLTTGFQRKPLGDCP
jgi:hypothetical protein